MAPSSSLDGFEQHLDRVADLGRRRPSAPSSFHSSSLMTPSDL